MAKLNTYGLNLIGVDKVVEDLNCYYPSGWENRVFIDLEDGKVWAKYMCDTDRVYYESDSIRQLGIVAQKKSAQWIYDRAIKLYEE